MAEDGPNTTPPPEKPTAEEPQQEGAQDQADIFLQTVYASQGKVVVELTSIFTGNKVYLGQGFAVVGTPRGDARVDFQFPVAGAQTPQAAFAMFDQAHAKGKADALAQMSTPTLVNAGGAPIGGRGPLKVRR
jgi:hypothetical protein